MKIHLLGPSGSGTTTLGKAIAAKLGFPHFDNDDFFWEKTNPPFTQKNPGSRRIELLKSALAESSSWVLSGSMLDWGDFLLPELDLIIYKYLPRAQRIERLKKRELQRFGNMILPGNNMHENYLAFIEWASNYETGDMNMRSKISEEKWMERATCKILRKEKEIIIDDEVDMVLKTLL